MIMCLQMVVWCKSVVEIRKSLCYGCSVHSHTHTLSLLLFLKACWQALHTHTHTHVRSLLEIRIRYSAGSYINTTHTCGRRLGSQQPLLLCVISLVCYYRPRLCVCVSVRTHTWASVLRCRIIQIKVIVTLKFWTTIKTIIHPPKHS